MFVCPVSISFSIHMEYSTSSGAPKTYLSPIYPQDKWYIVCQRCYRSFLSIRQGLIPPNNSIIHTFFSEFMKLFLLKISPTSSSCWACAVGLSGTALFNIQGGCQDGWCDLNFLIILTICGEIQFLVYPPTLLIHLNIYSTLKFFTLNIFHLTAFQ